AGCLVLFVPLQVALLATGGDWWPQRTEGAPRDRRWRRALAETLLLALTAGTLVLTQSRGAWVGIIVAIVAFLAWDSRTTRVVAALCVAGGAGLVVKLGATRLVHLTISQSGTGMSSDVAGRME